MFSFFLHEQLRMHQLWIYNLRIVGSETFHVLLGKPSLENLIKASWNSILVDAHAIASWWRQLINFSPAKSGLRSFHFKKIENTGYMPKKYLFSLYWQRSPLKLPLERSAGFFTKIKTSYNNKVCHLKSTPGVWRLIEKRW